MKRVFMLFACILLLHGCTENGELPPVFHNVDAYYFKNINNKDLVRGIKMDTLKIDYIDMVVVDTTIYKLRSYIDERLVEQSYNLLEVDSLSIEGVKALAFRSIYLTKYYNSKFTTTHSIRHEFYCPYIFGDEEYHTILVRCNTEHYGFKDKIFSLDGKAGNKLGNDIAEFIVE